VVRRRSFWLEGAIVGGIAVGLVGSGLCEIGDSKGTLGCHLGVFFLMGGGIGVPIGALICGQILKD